jgi:hypothetical protein
MIRGTEPRMVRRSLRLLRPHDSRVRLHWLNSDLAIGSADSVEGWSSVFEAGVRAVVDLRAQPDDLGPVVRLRGLRYLRLPVGGSAVPSLAELHIVSIWALQRIAAKGPILVQDGRRSGLSSEEALQVLQRACPGLALDQDQTDLFLRFAAEQIVPR